MLQCRNDTSIHTQSKEQTTRIHASMYPHRGKLHIADSWIALRAELGFGGEGLQLRRYEAIAPSFPQPTNAHNESQEVGKVIISNPVWDSWFSIRLFVTHSTVKFRRRRRSHSCHHATTWCHESRFVLFLGRSFTITSRIHATQHTTPTYYSKNTQPNHASIHKERPRNGPLGSCRARRFGRLLCLG